MTIPEAAEAKGPTTMKGHKANPRPSPNEMLIKRVELGDMVLTGRYMAARCSICNGPVHLGDSRRWRHGDAVGHERVAR